MIYPDWLGVSVSDDLTRVYGPELSVSLAEDTFAVSLGEDILAAEITEQTINVEI